MNADIMLVSPGRWQTN